MTARDDIDRVAADLGWRRGSRDNLSVGYVSEGRSIHIYYAQTGAISAVFVGGNGRSLAQRIGKREQVLELLALWEPEQPPWHLADVPDEERRWQAPAPRIDELVQTRPGDDDTYACPAGLADEYRERRDHGQPPTAAEIADALGMGAAPPVPSATAWEKTLVAKWGMPLEQIPGQVYALHFETPQLAQSVSRDYAGLYPQQGRRGFVSARPIRHYVGWTQQKNASSRFGEHAKVAFYELVYLERGTMRDEAALKLNGTCPKCGELYSADLVAEAIAGLKGELP